MADLTQRARELAEKLIDCIEVDFDLVNENSRVEIKGADEMILAALSDVRREALEEVSRRFSSWPHTGKAIMTAIQTLIDAPANETPVTAPGHTDLMVSPESIDAFMEANPLPITDPRDAEIERLLGIVKTMDEALEDAEDFGLHIPNNADDHDKQRIQLADDKITNAREAARQTLDCDLADK